MSSSKHDSLRNSHSDARVTRRSSTHLVPTPTASTSTSNASSDTVEDRRRMSTHSHHKKGVHDILYVHPTLRIVVSGLSGLLFGIALEKSRVFEPQIIRDQMLFRRFAMMKMFLAATGGGIISFSVIRSMSEGRKALDLAIHEFIGCIRMKTISSVSVGAGLLGCGMTLAGACPGLVTVQLGAGVGTAVYTILGCFFGGFLYAFSFPFVWGIFKPRRERQMHFLHEYVSVGYAQIALPVLIPIFFCILSMELYSPWETEIEIAEVVVNATESELPEIDPELTEEEVLKWYRFLTLAYWFGSANDAVHAVRTSYPVKVMMSEENVGLMRARAWSPYGAGILVGLLQIPIVLANQDTLGTSTSYITLGARILLIESFENMFAYFKDYLTGWINWWQVFFIGGSVGGGFLSAIASLNWATVDGVPFWEAFGGGLLMIYGARLAGGCTSGHGLSGMGLLAIMSFVAVPTMFASGVVTAFALHFIGFEDFL